MADLHIIAVQARIRVSYHVSLSIRPHVRCPSALVSTALACPAELTTHKSDVCPMRCVPCDGCEWFGANRLKAVDLEAHKRDVCPSREVTPREFDLRILSVCSRMLFLCCFRFSCSLATLVDVFHAHAVTFHFSCLFATVYCPLTTDVLDCIVLWKSSVF